jgi:hypothetical protein
MRTISARIWTRRFASRFESGSSMRKALGLRTMARPMATRWRCPPDRLAGLRRSCSSRSSRVAALPTFSRMRAFGVRAIFSAKPMFWATFMCG